MKESDIRRVIFVEWKEASSFVLKLSRTWFGKAIGPPISKKGRPRFKLPEPPLSVEMLSHTTLVEKVHQQGKQIYLDWRVGMLPRANKRAAGPCLGEWELSYRIKVWWLTKE